MMPTGSDRWWLAGAWVATFAVIFLLLALEDRVHQWRIRRRWTRAARARR